MLNRTKFKSTIRDGYKYHRILGNIFASIAKGQESMTRINHHLCGNKRALPSDLFSNDFDAFVEEVKLALRSISRFIRLEIQYEVKDMVILEIRGYFEKIFLYFLMLI